MEKIKTLRLGSPKVACDSGKRKEHKYFNLLGPEGAGWDGELPREGVGIEKFVPSLESFFLRFQGREAGMSWEFCRGVRDP